ncbi:hypothetical protein MRB53_032430 [Persea americana]|uniref:Uncharacterized protein n=1 Tax=Persea americana TaxID=3435 RepID=A0ACC2KSB9_PERAE|nr:hypothetical protein MRB53_032430 [Persea americana]
MLKCFLYRFDCDTPVKAEKKNAVGVSGSSSQRNLVVQVCKECVLKGFWAIQAADLDSWWAYVFDAEKRKHLKGH